jgi:hypothetical protein
MDGIGIRHDHRLVRARPGVRRAGASRAFADCGEDRWRLLEELRSVALHAEAADLLERRAEVAASPVLAALLRERAARHRGAADRLRGRLAVAARH